MGGEWRVMHFLPLLNPGSVNILPLFEEIPEEAEAAEAVESQVL